MVTLVVVVARVPTAVLRNSPGPKKDPLKGSYLEVLGTQNGLHKCSYNPLLRPLSRVLAYKVLLLPGYKYPGPPSGDLCLRLPARRFSPRCLAT